MTTNKPMTGEQLDELMTVAVNMQRDSEKAGERSVAMFAYAVQVAVLELRKVREIKPADEDHVAAMNSINAIIAILGLSDTLGISEQVAELKAQRDALASENAGLKEANGIALKILNDEETMVTSLWASSVQKVEVGTPSTDAFLAEVRAQGVEMFADSLGSPYVERGEECYQDGYTHAIERIKSHKAPEYAAQIRKGVQP